MSIDGLSMHRKPPSLQCSAVASPGTGSQSTWSRGAVAESPHTNNGDSGRHIWISLVRGLHWESQLAHGALKPDAGNLELRHLLPGANHRVAEVTQRADGTG